MNSQTMTHDPYQLLGIARDASPAQIKRAYRELARRLHPDRNPDPAAGERLKLVNAAYEILRDSARRIAYDRLAAGATPVPSGRQAPDGFDELLDALFGAASGAIRQRPSGADIEIEVQIDLRESIAGATRRVRVDGFAVCPDCEGRGGGSLVECHECRGRGTRLRPAHRHGGLETLLCAGCNGDGTTPDPRCGRCSGEGRITAARRLTLAIPQGAIDGTRVRFPRLGTPGRRGARPGDLVAVIGLALPAGWRREGRDLIADLHLDALDAALGGVIEVETPEETLRVRIPVGTTGGQEIAVAERGLPALRGRRRGELRLRVILTTPRLTPTQRRRIAAARGLHKGSARLGE